jgi:hypothetical protein
MRRYVPCFRPENWSENVPLDSVDRRRAMMPVVERQ